ncbi:MAG: secretin N-terminal domain-containing protein, partial [Rhodocyclaceae bacterium]|nr:secretin N-terminal domain-containing protein [Rhodocyclaceae bacterium]
MRILTLLPLLGLLTACTAPQPRPDVVRERIGEELAQAAVGRKSADAAERAMLMPFSVEMPKQENGEPRFDLSVVGAPAIQVFMAIVSGTRYNMLVGPEVTGAITISLKDVTVKETLESIRELYGYEFNIKGNRIHIQPHGLQMRVFKVNYLMARRSGRSSTSVSSGTGSPGGQPGGAQTSSPGQPGGGQAQAQMGGAGDTTSILTDTAEENQLWDDLRKAISVIIGAAAPLTQSGTATSTSGTASATSNISTQNVTINTMATTPGVVISPRSGMIVVRAAPRDLREVESYLKSTQIIVERQVMLEAKIMEVRLNEGYQAGVNWSAFRGGGNSNVALGSVGPGSALRPVNGTPAVTTRLVTDPSTGALVPYNLAYPDITSSVTSNLTTLGQTLTAPGVSVLPGLAGSVVAAAMGNGFVGLAFQTA